MLQDTLLTNYYAILLHVTPESKGFYLPTARPLHIEIKTAEDRHKIRCHKEIFVIKTVNVLDGYSKVPAFKKLHYKKRRPDFTIPLYKKLSRLIHVQFPIQWYIPIS